jgi:ABC-type phosphate/phosphonate transport system substrate-binding protein
MAVASLPMYDLPEARAATDALWQGLAAAFRRQGMAEVPARLWRGPRPESLWLDPRLLLSQTCGYPLTRTLAGRVRLVATPCYAVPGCTGSRYRSAMLVRADAPIERLDQLRGARCAISRPDSHSGMNALRALVAPLAQDGRFFGQVVVSGAVDVAAVDCVSHALIARYRPAALAGTRILGWTAAAPGLPLITAGTAGERLVERLRAGLGAALADPALAGAREALFLAGIEVLPPAAYRRIVAFERLARRHGYPELR